MKRPIYAAATLFLFLIAPTFADAQEVVQGPYGVDGSWNVYEFSEEPLTWAEALEDAQQRTFEGVTGDLVSIHSFEENQLVTDLALNEIVWIGSTDREGAAPLVEQNGFLSPQESIQLEIEEFLGAENVEAAVLPGWAWTSGEPFCFHNWAVGGEPNNWDGAAAGEADAGFEDATFIRADGLWNDAPSGYAEDEPVVATLQPGTSTEERDNLPNERVYNYVIEYRTNSASPLPGIEEAGDDPDLEPGCGPVIVNPVNPKDFDGDGMIGLGDVNLLLGEVAGAGDVAFDVNSDGAVDAADIQAYVSDPETFNTYLGDANLDGEFNSSDFVVVFTSGLFESGSPALWESGDWNGDGVFSSSDFVAAFTDGGYEIGPRAGTAAVPEPSSVTLILLSCLGLIRRRRVG